MRFCAIFQFHQKVLVRRAAVSTSVRTAKPVTPMATVIRSHFYTSTLCTHPVDLVGVLYGFIMVDVIALVAFRH